MKKHVVIVILALGLVTLFAVTAAPATACIEPLSPGFWKTHPEAWPGASTGSQGVLVGGIWYPQ